jgi:formyl-CoA transferase
MPSYPSDLFPCKGGGPNDYCFIYTTRASNVHWDRVLEVIGREDLKDDPRFATPQVRRENADAVDEIVGAWTRSLSKREVMRRLGEAGVPAGAVFDTMELSQDPHLREVGVFATVDHPVHGPLTVPGWPVQMSGSRVPITRAPLLGEHTEEVLSEVGYDEEQISILKGRDIVQ